MDTAAIRKVFNQRNRLNRDGKAEISIYVNACGQRKYISTKIFITPDQWDAQNRKVNKNNPNHVRLNHLIDKKVMELEKLNLQVQEEGGSLTIERVNAFLQGAESKDLISWMHREIENDVSVCEGTTRYRRVMLQRLKEAVGERVLFSGVNYGMLEKYNNHLIKSGYNTNTIKRNHSQLKKFLTIAIKKQYLKENPYMLYKIKRPPKKLQNTLWRNDIDRLWNLSYPENSHYELARLKFLFSCYTGLRISDNTNLKWDNIRETKLIRTQIKTGQPVVVPLNIFDDRPLEILQKAKELYNHPTYVFKRLSDQGTNEALKTVGRDAEIPFPLTFHAARHTFCTRVASETGSVFKVMEYAGILSLDTAQVYINLAKMYDSD